MHGMPTAGLFTSDEVAERLGVDRSTVLRMVYAGTLTPADRLPGSRGAYLFTLDAVNHAATTRQAS